MAKLARSFNNHPRARILITRGFNNWWWVLPQVIQILAACNRGLRVVVVVVACGCGCCGCGFLVVVVALWFAVSVVVVACGCGFLVVAAAIVVTVLWLPCDYGFVVAGSCGCLVVVVGLWLWLPCGCGCCGYSCDFLVVVVALVVVGCGFCKPGF